MSEWISVKDRLPKEGNIVVVWLKKRKEPACVLCKRDSLGFLWEELVAVDIESDREEEVSHWMPIPKAPMSET